MLQISSCKIGELVRNRDTREVWLVVDRTPQGLFVINLMLHNNNPAIVQLILERFADRWDRDLDIDDLEEWEAQQLNTKMDIIEQVQQTDKEWLNE